MAMVLPKRNIGKVMFFFIAAAFLWFGTFGLLYHMHDMKGDGHMNGCLFDGPAEICAMNFSEHIGTWQSMFTSLPQNISLMNMLVLALISAALLSFRRNGLELLESIASRWRIYIKLYNPINIFNFLREALSQGILNPKIYERAI